MPRLSRAGSNPQVAIDAGSSYELLMSLSTVLDIENQTTAEIGGQWISAARERAGRELLERLGDFTQGNDDFLIQLVPLAYDAPAPRTVASFLDHIATVDARDLLLLMAGYYDYHMRRAAPPETIRAAVDGDEGAARQFIAACEGYPDGQAFLARILATDPDQTKAALIDILGAWHERVWQAEEQAALPILLRDAEAKRSLALELPFDRFVETATNGVHFVPHAGIERLVLIPSWVHRPWVSYAEYGGAMFLVYPVADENLTAEGDAPPLRLLRLTKALGDEKRLRILRALAERPRSLMELAEQFEVPKTTMHHHMVTLRSAGLVSVGTGSKDYRIRTDVLPNLAQMLGGYLGGGAEAGSAAGFAGSADASAGQSGRRAAPGPRPPIALAPAGRGGEREG